MKTATINADAALDVLQQLEIFHHSLNAIANSLARHGLQPVDVPQLRECAAGLDSLRASLASTLPPLPPDDAPDAVVRVDWKTRANATRETIAQAQGTANALRQMAGDLEEEAFEAGHMRTHFDADDPDGRRGMIYTDARLAPMAKMARVLNQAAEEIEAIAKAQG